MTLRNFLNSGGVIGWMRWAALAAMAMVLLLEGRFHWEDWHARQGFRFVPVVMWTGTMEVWEEKRRGFEAVIGRSVAGTSGCRRELQRYEQGAGTREQFVPFVVSLRGTNGRAYSRADVAGETAGDSGVCGICWCY